MVLKNSNVASSIELFLDPYLNQRKMTHIFVATGYLDQEEPRYVFKHLPDDREVFDLASLTKALVTVPLVFSLLEKKKIRLNYTLSKLLPAKIFDRLDPVFGSFTIESLLRHKSGLKSWTNFWINQFETNGTRIVRDNHQLIMEVLNRLQVRPYQDSDFCYSDIGFILLGMVLELYFEKPLDILFQNLLEELGLPSKALFFPSPSDRGLGIFVPTSYCPLRCRILCGEVHDENAAALAGVAGHAGLFGSGESLLLFLKALNHSILGAKLIETNGLYLSDQGDPLMGWRQGSHRHGRGFAQGFGMGHLGFTGTAFFIDHLTGRYVICLTNRVISGREAPWMSDFRFGLFSALEGFFV